MPRSYWDYDSVNIQWGVLENYEVVRKIGWSPKITLCRIFGGLVSDPMLGRTWKIFGSFRGNQHHKLSEMRDKSLEACQKEEDKERNQNPAKSFGGAQYRRLTGCC